MSFCPASELSSCTVSVKSSCSSTPEGIFLSQDTRSPQTSSIFWLILQCHDPGYGILPCYLEPIEKTHPKNRLKQLRDGLPMLKRWIMCTIGGLGQHIGRNIGRLSTDYRSAIGRLSVDYRPKVDRDQLKYT